MPYNNGAKILRGDAMSALAPAAIKEERMPTALPAANLHAAHVRKWHNFETVEEAQRASRPTGTPHAMSNLRAIAYVSTASPAFSTEQLEWLLVEARALNADNRVTGVLLYNDGSIMQYFEGPQESMPATYDRIRVSRRHRDIIELMNEAVVLRSFDGWDMGLARPTTSDLLMLSTAAWKKKVQQSGGDAPGQTGLELLKDFWKSTRN